MKVEHVCMLFIEIRGLRQMQHLLCEKLLLKIIILKDLETDNNRMKLPKHENIKNLGNEVL